MLSLIKNYGKKDRIFLLVLFFFSFVIRLLFFHFFLAKNPCQLMYDSGQYHTVALSLAHGNGFTNLDGTPHFYRLPGYPIFLGAVYAVFGENPDSAMIIQSFLASVIPLFVYFLFLFFFSGNVLGARCAGLLASVHVGFLIFSGLVMTETFFLCFFLLFCLTFLSDDHYEWAGIFLGCASLFRSVGHYLVFVSLVLMVFRSQKMLNLWRFACGWLVVVIPWLVRNFMLTGLLFFDTLMGPHFLNHGATRVVMSHHHLSYDVAKKIVHDHYRVLLNAEKNQLQEPERNKIAEKLAFKIMLQHPYESANLCITNMVKTAFSLYSSELLMIDSAGKLPPYENNRLLSVILKRFLNPFLKNRLIIGVIYYELLFFLLMLFALVWHVWNCFFYRKLFLRWIPVFLFAALFIGLSCVCGFARLRIAVEPFLLVITAYYLSEIFRHLFKWIFFKVEPAK